MSQVHVEESRVMEAPADKIYGVIADYRVGHPAILPKPYFTALTVEEGGVGAGTVIHIEMNVYGVKRTLQQVVAEPEPGRVLTESNTDSSLTTTFTVEPLADGTQSRVTIATDFTPAPGLRGLAERLFNPGIMRRIYREELQQLEEYVQGQTESHA